MISESPVTSDPAVMLGRPVVAGTKVTVDAILDDLAEGATIERLQKQHPGLTADGIRAALRYAAEAVRAANPVSARAPLEFHGPHAMGPTSGPGGASGPSIAIRTYDPTAESVAVQREEGPPFPMERIHPDGVFEAVFPGEAVPFAYRLAVTGPGGETRLVEDPYRFSSVFTDRDRRELADAVRARGPNDSLPLVPESWYRKLGAHSLIHEGVAGTSFGVWAPHAKSVTVIGDFNDWDDLRHPLRPLGELGLWELFVPGLGAGRRYKYRIVGKTGEPFDKADPQAFAADIRPQTSSVTWDLAAYSWSDAEWMATREERQRPSSPLAIYEVHLGSWRRGKEVDAEGKPRWLTYRELADALIPYVKEMGYTHIEPMPVSEHPFDGSWGYQITGFFAATSRYGTPDDFRYFVDQAHQAGLGVILDWVPGHFPKDAHGLARFDGTALYEHADPRRSENVEWGTSAFNLESGEVAAFLLSNALFWLEEYHVDGLRVDAVSSMIYLDYSRQHWLPNRFGGRENLAAAAFLQRLNGVVRRDHPGVLVIAEESTAWPRVTGREIPDSLGFDLKWNLGWMHDTLGYVQREPVFRKHHHNELTFSLVYAFNENFLLPFSHDEVVHGKRSMLSKMPGDGKVRFSHLRTLYGYQYAHPGKKLQFMGAEFGQLREWDQDRELDWELAEEAPHRQLREFVRDLNRLYCSEAALHERDFGWEGFQWIDCQDAERSLLSFVRRGADPDSFVIVVVNFTPVERADYRLGVPAPGAYRELLNSDALAYGGDGFVNDDELVTEAEPAAGQKQSLLVTLPALGIIFLAPVRSR